ncbi:MAG TPA: nucleotide exchange factor GrpE [Solirubrobacteraceae bacterium]
MRPDYPRPGAPLSPEADTDSEATGTASESGPASELESQEHHHHSPKAEEQEPEKGSEPEAEADHEAQLEHDLEELTAKASKADEYLELAQRTKADFENYRKRAARETAAAQERGIVKLALELLPAVDNLDRALAASDGSGDTETLVSGLKLVHAGAFAALARAGIEPYSPEGERFDPQFHEAVAQQPVEGVDPGTIVEVYQRGYRLGDSVLRPARVVVAA